MNTNTQIAAVGEGKAHPCIRHERIIKALLPLGDVAREDMDRIAGASNSPHYVGELRHRHGFEGLIATDRKRRTDRDGKPCKPGFYFLRPEGIERAKAFLAWCADGAIGLFIWPQPETPQPAGA